MEPFNPVTSDTDQLIHLDELLQNELASTGQRFVNLLIDAVAFYVLIIVLDISLIIFLHFTPHNFINSKLISIIVGDSLYIIFYTLIEGATKGRTLGKLITKTVAVSEDGAPLTWKTALWRSLTRIVPFEVFSSFGGYPWHDTWTHTKVIKKRQF